MRKFIGDRNFYKKVLLIAVPVMIQNGITNFVSLLDNIMVGQVGTDQMSGVAIVNQLIFVFNLSIFGGLSGAGIFTAQYYGKNQQEGVRHTFRFKLMTGLFIFLAFTCTFVFGGNHLILQFLHEGGSTGNAEQTLLFANSYMKIMLWGLLPFAINQCYASTLRETGKTVLPMIAALIAVFVNLFFNYVLIFGKFGAPVMGVNGAAIATVMSRFVESAIIIIGAHRPKANNQFLISAYASLYVPFDLIKQIVCKGMPLLVNEFLWSSGVTMMNQCYSTRGLATVAGLNISNTIANIFNVVFIALGSSVSILVGQLLGAGKMEEAKDCDNKLIAFSVSSCVVIGSLMALLSGQFPKLYNTSQEVRDLARDFICISAACMPLCAFTHATYFTLRSGGKTIITFIFDSFYVWVVSVPIAWCLSRYTSCNIIMLFAICQFLEIFKCIIGYKMIKTGSWLQKIV